MVASKIVHEVASDDAAVSDSASLSPSEKKALRSKARLLDPVMRIGKNGLTANILDEIDGHLKRRKLIKLKLVKGFFEEIEKKSAAKKIASRVGAQIVDQVGFVIVLYRR